MSSARGKNRSSAKKRAEDIDSSDNELNANELHTSEIEEMKSAGPRGRKQRATPASARKSPGRTSSPKKEETKTSAAKSKGSKPVSPEKSPSKASGEFYGFTADDIDGKSISMSKYQGKLLLIVNVASRRGRTKSHYEQLVSLYSEFKNRGLEVLAFPCNQFGSQESKPNDVIKEFAKGYGVTFQMFSKIDVNKANAHPIFDYLKSHSKVKDIRWNFGKFLVGKTGNVIGFYDRE